MFLNTRIKLTAWYLLIIMFISLSFSFFIYGLLSTEIDRFSQAQRFRFERRFSNIESPNPAPAVIDMDLIEEVKNRLIASLALINGTIFLVSGSLGYLLAGRTLKPIQIVLEDQNRFISDASHELRTPLTAMKSSLEVTLRDNNLTLLEAKNVLKENISEVDNLQKLSDGLLELAQYHHRGNLPSKSEFNLKELLNSAISKVNSQAKAKKITITNKSKNSDIKAIKDYLSQITVILLDNAIKYTPNSSEILIKSTTTDKNIKVSIIDHGIGIGSKDLPHIFDRFYRADASRTKNQSNGYGLGLSIAKRLIQNCNGKIEVKSQIGKGSTFTIILPT